MSAGSAAMPSLSGAQRNLLEQRLRAALGGSAAPQHIPRRAGAGPVPPSHAQWQLWFLDRLLPGRPTYNVPVGVHLAGPLEAGLLDRSLIEIVRRHEVLRTTFEAIREHVVQRVRSTPTSVLTVVDLEALAEARRRMEAERLVSLEARRSFDLERGPLFRAGLIRLAREEALLLLNFHHIVTDGWSIGVLFDELRVLYQAFQAGAPPSLPDLPLQYADYALWEAERSDGTALDAGLAYWRRQLADLPVLELPTDRPRLAGSPARGEQQGFVLPASLQAALVKLSQDRDVTLFVTLLSAFAVLLGRLTGQRDIVVGSPVANRQYAELEGLVGMFVNTLVLRNDLSGDPSFHELLQRTREMALGAYAHQDVPLEKLVKELAPERDPGRNPLFQILFTVDATSEPTLALSGVRSRWFDVDTGTSKFDLSLQLREAPEGLRGTLRYDANLFDTLTCRKLARCFETLLRGVVADPALPVSRLPLLAEGERHQVLLEWNDAPRTGAVRRCVHELFEAQAARRPEALAVVGEEQALTYRELNERANRLAHLLRTLGVGPEARVALGMGRSPALVVALLGVLKAGGAYVPLDVRQGAAWLEAILDESRASVLMTEQRFLPLWHGSSAQILCLDSDGARLEQQRTGNPDASAQPENLAYVVFTSGSTGRPKGVGVEHRQLVNYVEGIAERLGLSEGVALASVSTFAADLGNTSVFGALGRGGCLHVISEERSLDAEGLAEYFERHPVDGLKIVPSHLQALQGRMPSERLLPRRWLVLGGEASPADWADALRLAKPGCAVWNHYGPAETTVGVLTHRLVGSADGRVLPAVPLGRPLPNSRVYVLDDEVRPVPAGSPGEVYIGGAGVARGYVGQPAMTAAAFLPDPFADEAGARLYRTGDRARHMPDGKLEFLGRRDQQVKLRGFRVELQEIETVLRRDPRVRDVAVIVREDLPGDKRLVAYVVARTGAGSLLQELRTHAQRSLPDYMVPSGFVPLDRLPLTPNGKLDRRALPVPPRIQTEPGRGPARPRTPTEAALAEIWSEVLDREEVGVHDNFFDLGGHSLRAIQVVSRIHDAFEVQLPVRCMFEAPTVARVAVLIEETLTAEIANMSEAEAQRLLESDTQADLQES